jgi:hypothetical protein
LLSLCYFYSILIGEGGWRIVIPMPEALNYVERSQVKMVFGLYIMLRDLLTQKSVNKKTVTGFRYPRSCRLRKYQFENRGAYTMVYTVGCIAKIYATCCAKNYIKS